MNDKIKDIIDSFNSLTDLDKMSVCHKLRKAMNQNISDAEIFEHVNKMPLSTLIMLFKFIGKRLTIPQKVDALMES